MEFVSVNVLGLFFYFKNEWEVFLLLGLLLWSWDVCGDIGVEWFWWEFDVFIFGDDILLFFVVGELLCCWGMFEFKVLCFVMNNLFDF